MGRLAPRGHPGCTDFLKEKFAPAVTQGRGDTSDREAEMAKDDDSGRHPKQAATLQQKSDRGLRPAGPLPLALYSGDDGAAHAV
jgi:hypothetical protein